MEKMLSPDPTGAESSVGLRLFTIYSLLI